MTDKPGVPSDGLLRTKPPKPTLAISREKVLLCIGAVGLMLAVGLVAGRASNSPKQSVEGQRRVGLPAYSVVSLPSSYAELPVPTIAPTARPTRDHVSGASQTLDQRRREERMQRAQSARLASVSFPNLQLPQDRRSSSDSGGAGPIAAATGSIVTEGADSDVPSNDQINKRSFLHGARVNDVTLNQRLMIPASRYQLLAGTVIPGLLLTALNSDLPGQILGQVSQNVFDTVSGNHLLVPQGTKIIGEYDSQVVYGQERVLIVWTRLIFPNGKSISLEGMPGVDLSGAAGLADQVNHHWGRLITSVVFSSLLGASAQIAQGRTYNSFDPDYGELATQGFAQNMNQVGQQITRKNLNIQPTIEIRPGFRFNVFVNKDVRLEGYGEPVR